MSESVISSTMFICDVLIAMVTWSGFGSSSASMWRVSSDSHFASPSSPSGENEIDPPTCRIISGTASRSRRSSSLNCDSRLEPLPSSSRTWMCSTVAPASQQSTACCTCWSMVSGMSSGKSAGAHSGPYGAAVMTSFSWFSGNRESSRKCMGNGSFRVRESAGRGSESGEAGDSGALHLADGGPVVLDGVVLGAAVVPDGEAVLRPAPADLVLGNGRLTDEVVQQLARAWRVVESEADVLRRVEIGEVRRERIDEEDVLTRLRVRLHDGVLGVGEALVQGQPLLGGHRRTEARLDAVPGPQAGDLRLHVVGEVAVGLGHVDPDGVAADRGALDAAQHAAEGRHLAPRGVAVEGVLVVLRSAVEVLVDAHQTRVLRVAARDRVVLERTEALRQRDVLAAGDVLVAEEEDLVLHQQVPDLVEEAGVARGLREADVAQLGADRRGEGEDLDGPGADAERRQPL